MAVTNSFDITSEVNLQEISNAIQLTNKEIRTRFDLKNSNCQVSFENNQIILLADDDFKLKSLTEILQTKLAKRSVPLKALNYGKIERAFGGRVRQSIELQQGIPTDKAKEIVKIIKGLKLKAQASIRGDVVRVAAKKRDVLQYIIQHLKEKDLGIHMQFTNFRQD
jgi:uncharacterized protein YajQ (UPF0234 family)